MVNILFCTFLALGFLSHCHNWVCGAFAILLPQQTPLSILEMLCVNPASLISPQSWAGAHQQHKALPPGLLFCWTSGPVGATSTTLHCHQIHIYAVSSAIISGIECIEVCIFCCFCWWWWCFVFLFDYYYSNVCFIIWCQMSHFLGLTFPLLFQRK